MQNTLSSHTSLERAQSADIVSTRRLIWLYCFLWLIEGAIRKWLLPQYSLQLLLIRDPLVLVIYYFAARAKVFPINGWIITLGVLFGLFAIQGFIQAMSGGVTFPVAVFGIRTFILHLPLIWVIPEVFGRKEILQMGRRMLWLAPFLAGLMVVQFDVGPLHWLNVGSYKGASQIGSVAGRIRPPGWFSFITGPIHFFALCSAFSVIAFLVKGTLPKWLAAVGVASALIAMGVAASRSLVMASGVVAAFGGIAALRSGRGVGAGVGLVIVAVMALAMISRFDLMKEGIGVFFERWNYEEEVTDTGRSTTGMSTMALRYGNGISKGFYWATRVPIFGYGVGITSNLAAETMRVAPPVEQEWERVIYEAGPLTGFPYLGFRAAIALWLLSLAYSAMRSGNYTSIILTGTCILELLNANLRQGTSAGFMSICCGLTLASLKAFGPGASEAEDGKVATVEIDSPVVLGPPRPRGRARFAVGGNPVRS